MWGYSNMEGYNYVKWSCGGHETTYYKAMEDINYRTLELWRTSNEDCVVKNQIEIITECLCDEGIKLKMLVWWMNQFV